MDQVIVDELPDKEFSVLNHRTASFVDLDSKRDDDRIMRSSSMIESKMSKSFVSNQANKELMSRIIFGEPQRVEQIKETDINSKHFCCEHSSFCSIQ